MLQVTLELLKGDAKAALSAGQRLLDEKEDLRLMAFALAEHDLGRTVESDRALAELIAMSAYYGQYQIAEVYAWRGDADHAFEWLERSHRERDPAIVYLKHDPLLRSIRTDPRYAALVEKANLPPDRVGLRAPAQPPRSPAVVTELLSGSQGPLVTVPQLTYGDGEERQRLSELARR